MQATGYEETDSSRISKGPRVERRGIATITIRLNVYCVTVDITRPVETYRAFVCHRLTPVDCASSGRLGWRAVSSLLFYFDVE